MLAPLFAALSAVTTPVLASPTAQGHKSEFDLLLPDLACRARGG